MSLLFGGNTFVVVQMWYPLKVKISSDFVHARKYYYSIYDTFGTFQTEAPAAPAADAKPSGEAVSLPEVQSQDKTELALPDQRQLKLILYSHGKQLISKLREPVRTVRLGHWLIYSGAGKHLSDFRTVGMNWAGSRFVHFSQIVSMAAAFIRG